MEKTELTVVAARREMGNLTLAHDEMMESGRVWRLRNNQAFTGWVAHAIVQFGSHAVMPREMD